MEPPIIPLPAQAQVGPGSFQLDASVHVVDRFGDPRTAFQLIQGVRRFTGLQLAHTREGHRFIQLLKVDGLPKEGYRLTVTEDGVRLEASETPGLFYSVQSFLQMIDREHKVPCASIEDQPRYAWRGMHMDVGRHYMPVAAIKRMLDAMALHKLNTFHWHLTEDQGWRIEIKKYPKLTEVSSWRKQTIGRPAEGATGDGIPHGGYYTQDQVREVVAYAAERHITVVPEIEMPGHAMAALAAYPELSCTGGPFEVAELWGVFDEIYCAGNDEVFEFNKNVLAEVLELFPSTFIHIGGDEAPKARWKQCPKCQARIQAEGLKDEHELQSYFIRRMDQWLDERGRRLIGWDEILEGGLAPGATVMSWRGIDGGIAAAKSGHDVVMTPTSHCYLDYYQSREPGEPEAIGGFLPLETVYGYEPTPDVLTEEEAKHILGAQGNLWTEYIPTPEHFEYMAFPRLLALAEVTWSPKAKRDFGSFSSRLDGHYGLLDKLGLNYYRPRNLAPTLPASVESTMAAMDHRPVLCAFDGNPNSQFMTKSAPQQGDSLTVRLEQPTRVTRVSVITGPGRHALRSGVLEVDDGHGFRTVATLDNGLAEAHFSALELRAVRLRVTSDQKDPLIVRELRVVRE